jgi:hypothetical protein
MSTLMGILKKLILMLMDDFEGSKPSMEEATADVVEIARELEVQCKNGSESLQSHHTI